LSVFPTEKLNQIVEFLETQQECVNKKQYKKTLSKLVNTGMYDKAQVYQDVASSILVTKK